MKDIYPEFADKVDFYAVGQDPTESLELMEQYRIEQGYPWPVAETDPSTLVNLRVLQESTKIAIAPNGVITYREVHGGNSDTWRLVLRQLSESVQ